MNVFDSFGFLKEGGRRMNRTKANLMKCGLVVSVVGVVVLHQTQVVSSQINHLALAVLFGVVGYLIVFKKFYFCPLRLRGIPISITKQKSSGAKLREWSPSVLR